MTSIDCIFTKSAGVASPTPLGSKSPQPATKPGALKSKLSFATGPDQISPGQPKDDEEEEKSGNLEIETGSKFVFRLCENYPYFDQAFFGSNCYAAMFDHQNVREQFYLQLFGGEGAKGSISSAEQLVNIRHRLRI